MLAAGKAYYCYASPEELTEMREKARAEGRSKLYDGRWRDRDPSEAPPERQAGDPPQGAAHRRDRDRGSGAGPRRLAEREPRRPRAAALRRQSDLHARRRGRRSRHGRHAHHPRRRSPDQRRAAETDLRCARLDRAGDGAHSADPRAGRREALQAPRRARRRGLSRDGLSARGDAQLSGAARLGAWRPGDLLDRRDDQGVRPAGDRPLARALRFRQAGKSQRPLHPPDRGRRSRRRDRARAALCAERRRACREAQSGPARKADRRDARPEGARQDADRADRERALPLRRPPARARRQGEGADHAGSARRARQPLARTGAG